MEMSRRRFAGLAGGVLLAGAASSLLASPAQAASKTKTSTPTIQTLNWAGTTWQLRDSSWSSGGPAYNGLYSAKNVKVNTDGTLTLSITNPTGSNPVSAEILAATSTGYGTYTITATGDFDNLDPDVVFGNFFLYDDSSTAVAGHNEIDGGEVSKWGHAGGPQTLTDTYYPVAAGTQTGATVWPSGVTTATFQLVWLPGSITWDAYQGPAVAGSSFLHSAVSNSNVPVPRNQRMHVNLWAFQNSTSPSASGLAPVSVTLNSYSFVPSA